MTKANLHLNLPGINQVIFLESRYLLPQEGQESTLYVVEKDELNGQQPTIYHYNGSEYVMISGGSTSGGVQDYKQVTKLGVVATPTEPRTYDISIPYTTNFLRAPVEVLKLTPGVQDVIKTVVEFDNSDADDFESNDYISFDQVMKLKTDYSYHMTVDTNWAEEGILMRKTINLEEFKKIDKMKVN